MKMYPVLIVLPRELVENALGDHDAVVLPLDTDDDTEEFMMIPQEDVRKALARDDAPMVKIPLLLEDRCDGPGDGVITVSRNTIIEALQQNEEDDVVCIPLTFPSSRGNLN